MRKPDSVNPELLSAFGARVRELRRATGATARDFAEANDYDRNLWGRIERGRQNVSLSTLHKIAAALGVALSELVSGLEEDVREGGGDRGDGAGD